MLHVVLLAAAMRAPPPRMAAPPLPPPSSFPPYALPDHFRFEVLHQSSRSRARVGRIHTPHGVIDTPGFVPVGTNGALKGVTNEQASAAGTQLMFCNTYHLLVHPGPEVVAAAGGLQGFLRLGAGRPLITDSGGFQVFSLARAQPTDAPELKRRASKINRASDSSGSVLRVSEAGVVFRSYFDGSTIELTPESSIDAQKALGADIIIPLDELPAYRTGRAELERSVAMTHRWEARSLRRHLEGPHGPREQAIFGVIHGGVDRDLRTRSAEYLTSLPFDGFAVGGALGKDRDEMLALLEFLMPALPADRPTHLLGIADATSMEAAVRHGIDSFDSCYPTRLGRHGTLLTRSGPVKIKSRKHRNDHALIDPGARGVGGRISFAYLHHLWKAYEPLAPALITLHNIEFMVDLAARLRLRILRDEI